MASNAPDEVHLDISGTFGISYIGAMIAMVLYGITTLQTYLYFNSAYYPKDPTSRKVLVTTIWCLETLQVALVCHAMYHYLIINYSNPSALQTGIWSLFTSILANVIISTLVQIFFAIRVHKLSKMWWLTILIMVTILAHVAFGIETVILMLILKQLDKLPSITYTAALPFAITAVFPDVLIACSLCYFLQTKKPNFEGANAMLNTLKGTNAMLNTLIIYAVNRCLLTSVVVIIEVILFKILPDSFYFLAVDFCVGKLYANSMLAALNTREYVGGIGHGAEISSNTMPSHGSAPTPQFRGARQLRGYRNDPLELTDLSAAWPSGVTRTSVESVPGIQADLRRMAKRTEKDELDFSIPLDVVAVDETQGSESEREHSQKRVPLTS